MTNRLYPKLAWSGIRKNGKLYIPYLASCTGMVMMFYIIQSVSVCPLLSEMRGGSSVKLVLLLGKFVIAFFALLFLFYTNSFLIRRRYKEFGLYNVLGMDKRGISRIVLWESLITAGISLFCGTGLGILFSKLAELGLLNAVRADIDYRFTVRFSSVLITIGIFALIFFLLLLKSLLQVRHTDPLILMHSEKSGERAPRANWLPALLGILMLGCAYALAVTIKSPLTALVLFFAAVLLVIAATYLLFISGSVALCRLLQKKKSFYYKKDHFVSVSSMAYRMKRNGAGLASICILSTMVLVMISSTASLYFGADNHMNKTNPNDVDLDVQVWTTDNLTDAAVGQLRAAYDSVFSAHSVVPENVTELRYADITANQKGTFFDPEADTESFALSFENLRLLVFLSAEDYTRLTNQSVHLSAGEALLQTVGCSYSHDTLSVGPLTLRIAGTFREHLSVSPASSSVLPTLLLIVPDHKTLRPLDSLRDEHPYPMLDVRYEYRADLPGYDNETIKAVFSDMKDSVLSVPMLVGYDGYSYSASCRAETEDTFYSTYGGLFFLGILLSLVFIFAAAMIIYYKQISEGYEDAARFSIMQKVGMTKEDIRKSVNSQVLTVFFAPLLLAGLHLGFAFPFIWKILLLFEFDNLPFILIVTLISYLAFGALYALLYRVTARSYYSIVSGGFAD